MTKITRTHSAAFMTETVKKLADDNDNGKVARQLRMNETS